MSIKNLRITQICDLCPMEITLSSTEEIESFEENWFTSLMLDLCPTCKLTEAGIEKIIDACEQHEKLDARFNVPETVSGGVK